MLERFVRSSTVLHEVAMEALERCHFGETPKDECEAACYECLLSFGNQHEATQIDRRTVELPLKDLCNAKTLRRYSIDRTRNISNGCGSSRTRDRN